MGSSEFIKGNYRYCLWIEEHNKIAASEIPEISNRINSVKQYRLKSDRDATKVLAKFAYRFGEVRHENVDALLIPRHSSETREYIPIGFFNSETIIADSALAIYGAQPWLFGIIHSKMHMSWIKVVGGKLKTQYRYSAKLCYNTFPFPDVAPKQKENLNLYVFAILDERAKYPKNNGLAL